MANQNQRSNAQQIARLAMEMERETGALWRDGYVTQIRHGGDVARLQQGSGVAPLWRGEVGYDNEKRE